MTAAELARWRFADIAAGAGLATPVDELISSVSEAEERALQILTAEESSDLAVTEGAPPTISVVDETGHPITGVSLMRDPGADTFTLILLTKEEL